jgi:proteasome accessory factor A
MNASGLIPKIVGLDNEFANWFWPVPPTDRATPACAVGLLLAAMPGIPADERAKEVNLLDRRRRFFAEDGSSAYDDSDHLEMTTGECAGAREHLAAWCVVLDRVRDAQALANQRLGGFTKIHVAARNADSHSNSFGGHQNYTVSRRAFSRTIRDPLAIGHLASLQAALAVLVGQGKVGADRFGPHVDFQLSQRADYMSVLVSSDTMVNRSLVNSRDESHADEGIARQHVICFDSILSHVGRFVNIGVMQLELCLIELGAIEPTLILAHPIDAMQAWSRDVALTLEQPLGIGGQTTLIALLRRHHDTMARLVASGFCEGIVPDAAEILTRFAALLDLASARDYAGLARVVDWAGKLALLECAAQHHQLAWDSPEMKRLDYQWGAIEDGFYFDALADGTSERLIEENEIVRRPSSHTRAYTRARLLQLAPADCIERIDWDHIDFRFRGAKHPRPRRVRVSLPVPFGLGEKESGISEAATLDEALRTLDQQHGVVTESSWQHAPAIPSFQNHHRNDPPL